MDRKRIAEQLVEIAKGILEDETSRKILKPKKIATETDRQQGSEK